MNRKGVAQAVVIVLIILISAASVAIIYPLVKSSVSTLDNNSASKCLSLTLRPLSCEYNENGTVVRVGRSAGAGDATGLRFVFSEDSEIVTKDSDTAPGELETSSYYWLDVVSPSTVDIAPLIGDSVCAPTGTPVTCVQTGLLRVPPACLDGIDNDNDGLIDFPLDGGCSNANDENETDIQPACSDGVDNDLDGRIDFPADLGCMNATDSSEIDIIPLLGCEDGVDNDDDGWADVLDPDCRSATDAEQWFGLSACSDGFDNDRDGLVDSVDTGCSDLQGYGGYAALDANERDNPTFPACSDGVDNDDDGLFDYPLEPGCSSASDTTEDSELRGLNAHNFNVTIITDPVAGQAYPSKIQWKDSSNKLYTIMWDEQGRFGPAWVKHHWHSTYSFAGWSYKKNSVSVSTPHAGITYRLVSQTPDLTILTADDGDLHVRDYIRFVGDTMYITTRVTNEYSTRLDDIRLDVNIGHLNIGSLGSQPQGLSRVHNKYVGEVQDRFYLAADTVAYEYPSLTTFSPLAGLGDSNVTVGFQLLTEVYQPTAVNFREYPNVQNTPEMVAQLMLGLEPSETRSFTFAVKVAKNSTSSWQQALSPYKQWFDYTYGTTPLYCPSGPFSYVVATNFYNEYNYCPLLPNGNVNLAACRNQTFTPNRYYPGVNMSLLFPASRATLMKNLGIGSYGIWALALNSQYLNLDGQSTEFNPNIELLDPNLDAARNITKVGDFVRTYNGNNVKIFWFARPCAEITGSGITYNSLGVANITKGSFQGVDLRNVVYRDRQIARMDYFVRQGVDGFYLDAVSCPGDTEFVHYALRYFKQKYNKDILVYKEGAVDRESLWWPQIPHIKPPTQPYNTQGSLFTQWLVPSGTFYGGVINDILTPSETTDALGKGYQLITNPTSSLQNCQWVNASYANRYARWQSYGQALGCPAPARTPPVCPASS